MVQTTASSASRRSAGSATAAVLLGAGLACAGNAHAGVDTLAPESAETAGVAIPAAIDLPAMPTPTELSAQSGDPITVAARAAEPVVAASVVDDAAGKAVETIADAPARGVVPVDKATVARHHPVGDTLATAMTMAAREPDSQVAEARNGMARWKPVAQARLDESRGGFDVGGLQVGFGIDRAVFVNGALAVATSITIPNVASMTSAQAAQLAQALIPVTVAVTNANSAANTAIAAAQAAVAAAQGTSTAAQGAAGQAGQSATTAANGAAASAQGAAGAAASTSTAAAVGGAAQAAGAAGMAQQAAAAAAGTVVTNGLLTVVQNGPANTANVGSVANMPATVIQNTLNNQNIQSLMTINASVNTLAAFRAQMANTALNSVIPRMAGMR